MSSAWDPFTTTFNKVTGLLKQEGKIGAISGKFAKFKSDKDRMAFIMGLEAVQELVQPVAKPETKSLAKWENYKSTGNSAFKGREYRDAVLLYTDSLAWAPAPTEEAPASESVALSFANRSAALFYLKDYMACLRDIQRAFDHQYPAKLAYKIHDRRARCWMELRKYEEAVKSFQAVIDALSEADVSEDKKETLKADAEKQIEACKKDKESAASSQEYAVSKEEKLKLLQEIPTFSEGHNESYPSLSSACDVTFAPGQGRFITAVRDIAPGEVILIEKPYASVLLPCNYGVHCHHCFAYTLDLLPCDHCPDARYCSEACKETAWKTYHRYECPILGTIHHSKVGKFGHLALRTITSQTKSALVEFKEQVQQGLQVEAGSEAKVGCNKEGIYQADDFNTIYNLVTHAADRPLFDLFRRSIMAVYLLKCLQQTTFFTDGNDNQESAEMDKDLLAFIGGLLLSHLQSYPCNAHEVPTLYLNMSSIATSLPVELGAGIYSALSLFNHSCDPAANRNFYGDICVVRAIKAIPKGAEVSDNYGAVYPVQKKEERLEKLKPQYYFECGCEPCTNNWPLYQLIENQNPRWRCANCSTPLSCPAGTNSGEFKCDSCEKVYNIADMAKALAESQSTYKDAFELVLKGDVEPAYPVLLHHLAVIQELVCLPWREFNDCQEAVKQCLSIMGNCTLQAPAAEGCMM